MVKIPGYVYLIIGAVMVGFSLYTNGRTGKQSMTVFIYIGLLFLAVGIAKLIFNYVTREQRAAKDLQTGKHPQHPGQPLHHTGQVPVHSMHPQHPHPTGLHPSAQTHPMHPAQSMHHPSTQSHLSNSQTVHHYPQHSEQQTIFPQVIVCKRCSARNPLQSSFCNRCGYSLK